MSTEERVTRLETTIESISSCLLRLEIGQNELENKLAVRIDKLDSKMDTVSADLRKEIKDIENKVDAKFERLEAKIDKVDSKIDISLSEIRKEMRTDFRWLLAGIGTLFGIMAHGFHWF